MRKLGLFALVLGLIIAFALPVSAYTISDGKDNKFTIGGTWLTDFGYWNKSRERNTGGTGDLTQLMLNVPAHTSLRGSVESGSAGGFFELGLGTGTTVPTGTTSYMETRKMYGFYKFGNCELRVGKDDGWLFSLVPQQRLGANLLTVWDFGFGNFYDGRFAQIRFTQDISKQFRYAISLVAPQVITDAALAKASYSQIPTIAAKFTLNFGVVSLFPAFAWSQVKWDNVTSGYDDSVTAYYAVLPVKVVAGAFTGLFQAGYGQNLGNVLNPGNANTYQVYQRLSSGQVKNTTGYNGFIDLGFSFGPVTPHVFAGIDNATNTDAWRTGDNYNTRMSYGMAVNYQVSPSFMISPELTFFDFGNTPNTAGAPAKGKDWMGGVQFVFAF